MVIGWTALIIGALGLVHIANGTPRLADGSVAMQAAGGLIGYVASAPLVAAVTPWVAAPLLALVDRLRAAGGDRDAAAPGAGPARRACARRVLRRPAGR